MQEISNLNYSTPKSICLLLGTCSTGVESHISKPGGKTTTIKIYSLRSLMPMSLLITSEQKVHTYCIWGKREKENTRFCRPTVPTPAGGRHGTKSGWLMGCTNQANETLTAKRRGHDVAKDACTCNPRTLHTQVLLEMMDSGPLRNVQVRAIIRNIFRHIFTKV